MITWKVKYEDPIRHKVDTMEIFAATKQEAISKARRKGRVLSINRKWGFSLTGGKLKLEERQVFLQRLSTMQECRVGASEALKLLETTFTGNIRKVSNEMLRYVQQGDDIPTAMKQIGQPRFPKNMVALIHAGSRAGNTAAAIRNAAEFEIEIEQVKRGSEWLLWMSVFGFMVAAAVILGTKFYLAPMIMESQLVKMAGDAVDTSRAVLLMDFSAILMGVMTVIFMTMGVIATFGRLCLPDYADKLITKIPFYKDLVLAKNNYITLYALSTLVSSGVPMEESLLLSASSSSRGVMRNDLLAAADAVKKGRSWPIVMRYLHPTDRAALASSQDRSQTAKTLRALSDQYRTLYAQCVKAITPMFMMVSAIFLVIAGVVLYGLGVEPMLQIAAKGSM